MCSRWNKTIENQPYRLRSWGGKPGTGATGSSLTMIHAWGEPAVCRDVRGSSFANDSGKIWKFELNDASDTSVAELLRCRLRALLTMIHEYDNGGSSHGGAVIMAIITIPSAYSV